MNFHDDFTVRLKIDRESTLKITDSEPMSVKCRIEATHSGMVNGNKFFYPPDKVRDGAKSFISPYNKPVTTHHDSHADPIGRVVGSRYVDYGIASIEGKGKGFYKKISDFVKSTNQSLTPEYKGLGHIELEVEITDAEAIKKVRDGRYLTVSIGAAANAVYCSICGTNKKTDSCDHWRGEMYDSQECFYISGNLEYDHISYVNTPADKNAVSTIITDELEDLSYDGSLVVIEDNIKNVSETKKPMNLDDFKTRGQKIEDLLSKYGVSSYKDSLQKSIDKARSSSFAFSQEKSFLVTDHVGLAIFAKEIEDLEDSAEKEEIKGIIDSRWSKIFGDQTVDQALDALSKKYNNTEIKDSEISDDKDVDAEKTSESKDAISTTIDEETISKIALRVVDTLKNHVESANTYSVSRLKAVESDLVDAELEITDLRNQVKSLTVDMIMSAENKLEDSTYKQILLGRNIESLTDKLDDIRRSEGNFGADPESISVADAGKVVDEADESLSSGNADGESASINDSSTEEGDLTVSDIRDEYRRLFLTEGSTKAREYLKRLRDCDRLPKNFTFNQ
jgi:hypothetical protein